MSQTPQKHQAELKKSQTASTSSLHKTKVLLPSRYIQMGKNEKTGLQKILNSKKHIIYSNLIKSKTLNRRKASLSSNKAQNIIC